ncbi:hypothetical protein B0H10DRAFT_2215368 [Mycena sp. CBHHK59/15]|nr:hypothetical protein B0H10DRAFT_2215368 [Mycena sp. CBHHK59/15]
MKGNSPRLTRSCLPPSTTTGTPTQCPTRQLPAPAPPPTDPAPDADDNPAVSQKCQWQDCSQGFPDPETLTTTSATTTSAARAPTTSASPASGRTAAPPAQSATTSQAISEPHVCEICKKSFKRPQDLKKHEKIHTEEHHAQHKHSKAITVADPAYVSRAPPSKSSSTGSGSLTSAQRAQSHSSSASDGSYPNFPPTPSPDFSPPPMQHHSHNSPSDDIFMQNHQLPGWEVLREGATTTGSKRAHDYSVDDFFTDMKKRRVSPSYDPRMAERLDRLNQMSYSHHSSNFNPRSVSLDIRTPEELAAVNDFLITLGRDVADGAARPNSSPHGASGFSSESYFDPVSLSQLGLAGMPGMPGSGHNYPHDHSDHPYPNSSHPHFSSAPYSSARSTHPSVQPGQYPPSLYPSIDDPPLSYAGHGEYAPARRPSKYASYPQHYHQSPPHDGGSPHSASAHSTPPQMSVPPPDAAVYDYLRPTRGAPPAAQLAPADYMVCGRQPPRARQPPVPVEPKITSAPHRGPPARLSSSVSASSSSSSSEPSTPSSNLSLSSSGSLYPLLTSGDIQYKLPPLMHHYRSPSPPSTRESTPSVGSAQSSPTPTEVTILPSLRSIAPPPMRDSDDVACELGRIQLESRANKEIPAAERRRHAEVIRNLLVTINTEFRRLHGTPPPMSPPRAVPQKMRSPGTSR